MSLLSVYALIHPKGAPSGWGQDCVQACQVKPHQTVILILMDLALCVGAVSCLKRKEPEVWRWPLLIPHVCAWSLQPWNIYFFLGNAHAKFCFGWWICNIAMPFTGDSKPLGYRETLRKMSCWMPHNARQSNRFRHSMCSGSNSSYIVVLPATNWHY